MDLRARRDLFQIQATQIWLMCYTHLEQQVLQRLSGKQNASLLGSLFQMSMNDVVFMASPLTFDPSVVLALGGEACPSLAQLRSWKHKDNQTSIYNIYGITEVSCWASCYRIPELLLQSGTLIPSSVALGTPLMDMVMEVRDEGGFVITEGEGQVFIDVIYTVRDPSGNRPLCIGKLVPISRLHSPGAEEEDTEVWVVSSESCSFQSIGAKYYREVLPGELVQLSRHGVKSLSVVPRPEGDLPAFCIFEYVYFARPDSIFEGQMVYSVRQRCGRQLAIEAPTDVDLVSTVPESATPAALGYALQAGLPYMEVLCKNRYVRRTFIQPNTRLRQLVHIRVAFPPIKFPCYMGINIPTKEERIANKPEFKDIAGYIGADSVEYLTVEGLLSAVQEGIASFKENEKFGSGKNGVGHSTACLTGKYPVEW
ncbi:amidophosphoribosyltransferase-like [Cyprinodon tularosa]|uniref:amidophosphoribosyltransferase-like n=1 Tax=Cyprinodon tularosa TaxID=77115 RepID=UPI0018E27067|nr:amidophosphoribosyltransferase-like [Cyprinodon tularosa]